MICMSAAAVWICSRPRRDSSDMMSTWNGGRGERAFISRMKPGRLTNSDAIVDEDVALIDDPALAGGVGSGLLDLWRVTDLSSSGTPGWSVDFRARIAAITGPVSISDFPPCLLSRSSPTAGPPPGPGRAH